MAEPAASEHPFALLAVFSHPGTLLDALGRTREAGFTSFDACSPFPIEGMGDLIGKDRRVAWWTLAGGIAGAAGGFALQACANWDYPINIGGRPLIAIPAFMLITFEVAVLGAIFAAIFAMLLLNRLPRLNHPLFDSPQFSLATADRFFLVIFGNDPLFDVERSRAFLADLAPLSIELIGRSEEPE